MSKTNNDELLPLLKRVADALERLAPAAGGKLAMAGSDAFVWQAESESLEAVSKVNRIDYKLLQGIDRQTEILFENTQRFAKGFPANNALLWGARGTGKSSLVKAIHARVNAEAGKAGHQPLAREAYKTGKDVWSWSVGITNSSGHKVAPTYKDNPASLKRCLEVFELPVETDVRLVFAADDSPEAGEFETAKDIMRKGEKEKEEK